MPLPVRNSNIKIRTKGAGGVGGRQALDPSLGRFFKDRRALAQ